MLPGLTFPDAVRITIKVSFELRKMKALAFHRKATEKLRILKVQEAQTILA